MKKLLLLCITFIAIKKLSAQIATTLVINPTPTAVLSEWTNDNSVINYVVNFQGAAGLPTLDVIIKAELKSSDGSVVATTDLSKATVYTLTRGSKVFYARDVFPLQIMIFNGSYKNTLQRTGKLPSGTYLLSVQLLRPGTFDVFTQPDTRSFNLAAIHLPVLMKPYNEENLKAEEAQTAIIFRWIPVTPTQTIPPYYRLQVFEILNYQTPLQALRANQPLLDVTLRAQNQYIWRPQLSFITDTLAKKFIWTIQSQDANHDPLVKTDGNGESRSEPIVFYVLPKEMKKLQ